MTWSDNVGIYGRITPEYAGMPKQWAAMGLDALYSIIYRMIHAINIRVLNTVYGRSSLSRWRPRLSPIANGTIVALWLVKW